MATEREQFVDRLKGACDRESTQMAVCDMLGRKYQDDNGIFKTITRKSPLSVRYELRSRQHVAVYNFIPIYTNYGEEDA